MGDVPEIPELGTWDVRPRPDPTLDGDLDAGPVNDLAELDADDAPDADDAEPLDLPVPLDLPALDTGRDVPPPPGDRGCAADPARACTPGQARNCGRCGSQVCTEACAWTDCAGEGECAAGQTRSCGGCGTQRCSSACAWEACPTQGECTPGQTRACGNCGRQTCTTGCQWGTCTGMGECAPGQTPRGHLRPLFAADLHERLHLGRVRAAPRQRVRVPQRHQQSCVRAVPVWAPVVPRQLPMEHRVYVVLLGLRRLPRAPEGRCRKLSPRGPAVAHRAPPSRTPSEATTRWHWSESW
jgi:hypothetical protein